MADETRGFTLIELLIVVAIIGILAAIAVPNFLNAQTRAKIAKAEGDMKNMETALESYKLDNGIYPPWHNMDGTRRNPVNRRLNPLTSPVAYMASVPLDPFVYGAPGMRLVEGQHEAYVTYDYTDDYSTIHWAKWAELNASWHCSVWRISSYGPDGLNNYGLIPSYHSSNGLKSPGDLNRFGARTSLPCDPSMVGR